jgi:hypothetical protein
MASGILGNTDGNDTNQTVYTVGASTLAVVNVSICNTTASADDVVLYALGSGDSAATATTIEDLSLGAGSVIERTNIVLEAGGSIVFNASAGTAISVWGIEEAV